MKRILFLFALITSVLVFTGCEDDKCLNGPDCVNGNCNPETGLCECADGNFGDNCELCDQNVCEGTCNSETGECEPCIGNFAGINCADCAEGWAGENCDIEACADTNCTNGTCNPTTNLCDCDAGWTGANCDILACVDADCGENGECDVNGNCACLNGWVGELCDCNGNNATIVFDIYGIPSCDCDAGWTGIDCNTPTNNCPAPFIGPNCDCNSNNAYGFDYTTNTCNCLPGFTGIGCETQVGVNGSFVGTWEVSGTCVADSMTTYPIYYTATIFEDMNSNTVVSNFGGWNTSPVGIVSGNDILINDYVVYTTDAYGNDIELFVSGSGVLNANQDQIIFEQISDGTLTYVVCTETWILQP